MTGMVAVTLGIVAFIVGVAYGCAGTWYTMHRGED